MNGIFHIFAFLGFGYCNSPSCDGDNIQLSSTVKPQCIVKSWTHAEVPAGIRWHYSDKQLFKMFQVSPSPVPALFSSQDVDLSIHHCRPWPVPSFFHGGAHGPLVGFWIVTLHLICVLCWGVPSSCQNKQEIVMILFDFNVYKKVLLCCCRVL